MCLFCLTLVGCGEIHAKHSIEGKGFETIHLDTLEFHGTKSEFMEEVKPPEPVEYYNYFEPHSGYQYFVISGTLKNNGDSQVLPNNCAVRKYSKRRENGCFESRKIKFCRYHSSRRGISVLHYGTVEG